mgnify:CR=1 FL=1
MTQSKSEGARGYMDMNTPIDNRHLLNMSLATRKETAEECLEISRGELKKYVERYGPCEVEALKEGSASPIRSVRKRCRPWYEEVVKYQGFKLQLAGINAELEKKTGENYHTMFRRVAGVELSKDILHGIDRIVKSKLNELHATVE